MELRPGFLARMIGSPLCFVAVDVAADLRRPRAEPAGVRRQFADLTGLRVEGEPCGGEGDLLRGAVLRRSTYENLGFTRDRNIGKHRWVVTKVVGPSS